jgi:hypothetical protein
MSLGDEWGVVWQIVLQTLQLNPKLVPYREIVQVALLNRKFYLLTKDHHIKIDKNLDCTKFNLARKAFEPNALELKDNNLHNSPEIQWLTTENQSELIDYSCDTYVTNTKRRCITKETISCLFVQCCHITTLKIHWFFSSDILNLPEELERLILITELPNVSNLKNYPNIVSAKNSHKKRLFLAKESRLQYLEFTHEYFEIYDKNTLEKITHTFPNPNLELRIKRPLKIMSEMALYLSQKVWSDYTMTFLPDLADIFVPFVPNELRCDAIRLPFDLFDLKEDLNQQMPFICEISSLIKNLQHLHVHTMDFNTLSTLKFSHLISLVIECFACSFSNVDSESLTTFPPFLQKFVLFDLRYRTSLAKIEVPSSVQFLELYVKIHSIIFDQINSDLHTFFHLSNSKVNVYPLSLKHLVVDFGERISDRISGSNLPPIVTLGLFGCSLNILKKVPKSLKIIYTNDSKAKDNLTPAIKKISPEIHQMRISGLLSMSSSDIK